MKTVLKKYTLLNKCRAWRRILPRNASCSAAPVLSSHSRKGCHVLRCSLSHASLSYTQQITLLCNFDLGSSLPGGPDNQVHFEGYQVSNQCMALVRDECLLPCRDAPELGYAKESSSEQYVPDVFYKVSTACLWEGGAAKTALVRVWKSAWPAQEGMSLRSELFSVVTIHHMSAK